MTEPTQPDTAGPAEVPPPVTINLDILEREGAPPEPFTFQWEGRHYTLFDPKEVDWQDLVSALTNPFIFFRVTMKPEDQVAFFGTKLPAWRLNKLVDTYVEHFGLPSVGDPSALPH